MTLYVEMHETSLHGGGTWLEKFRWWNPFHWFAPKRNLTGHINFNKQMRG